jgi:hypothetical protein
MDNPNIALIAPTTVNCTVALRKPNAELRTREHLTTDEVEKLIDSAARTGKATVMHSWCCLPFVMDCEQPKSVICAGNKSTSLQLRYMSAALSTARLPRIR